MNWNKTVKAQMLAAGTMTLLGFCVCAYSQSYLSAYDITEIIEKQEEAYLPAPVNMGRATPETAVKEEPLGFQASLTAFNLAFLYPDANASSLGTKLVEALSKMESDWLSSIYELAVSRPESLAASLGMETGDYKNASWNKVEITFYDENNNLITAKSNIQEIISMANTYFYYSAPEDYDSFLAYASQLFEGSHSVRYSISDVYYCDGSLEQEVSEDDDDLSEDLVQAKGEGALESGGLNGGPGVQRSIAEGPGGSSASSADGTAAILESDSQTAARASAIPAVTDPYASLEGAVSAEAGGNGASGNAGETGTAAVTSAASSGVASGASESVVMSTEAAIQSVETETSASAGASTAGLNGGSGETPLSTMKAPESAEGLSGSAEDVPQGAGNNDVIASGRAGVSSAAADISEGEHTAGTGADGSSQAVQTAQAGNEAVQAAQAGNETSQTVQAGNEAVQTAQMGNETSQTAQVGNEASQTARAGDEAVQPGQNSGGEETKSLLQGKTEQAAGEAKEIGPGIALMESKASSAALETGAVMETSEPLAETCPGHADLHITAVISGLSNSDKGLFLLDSVGKEEVGSWQGWTEENKNYALQLAAQNWEEIYGFTMSPAFIMSPLSSEEINGYLKSLPENISEDRKVLIRYALSSVGRVPYYWGGKPSVFGYDGNHFGSLITPDRKGRSMKGLDCSGWINWVYWSALGKRLPCQGTGGLSSCGTAVNREDLQPGDIILKTGSEAHVVMFLKWEEDGTMKVIHESSAAVNNVTISTMTAQWPYYRKLID